MIKTAIIIEPYYDTQGYDTYVKDNEHQVYAVFDGMGVSEGSRYASSYCKHQTEQNAALISTLQPPRLARLLDEYSMSIAASSPNGGTTGVIVRIDDDGQLYYAKMGDSRLYIFRDGEVTQIGRDEGEGNMLSNYIGKYSQGCQQWGTVPNWDKFMLCSDGITGDWPEQFIDPADIKAAFELSTPKKIATQFITLSRKPDDKTIIVGIK